MAGVVASQLRSLNLHLERIEKEKSNSHLTNFRELLGPLWEEVFLEKTEGLGIKMQSQAHVAVETHIRTNSIWGNMQAGLAWQTARHREILTTCLTRWNGKLGIKLSSASLSNLDCNRAHGDLSSSIFFYWQNKDNSDYQPKNPEKFTSWATEEGGETSWKKFLN